MGWGRDCQGMSTTKRNSANTKPFSQACPQPARTRSFGTDGATTARSLVNASHAKRSKVLDALHHTCIREVGRQELPRVKRAGCNAVDALDERCAQDGPVLLSLLLNHTCNHQHIT